MNATKSASTRSLRVEVANLTEPEQAALASIVALFADPHLGGMKRAFLAGRLCVRLEDGLPTWIHRTAPSPFRQN